MKMNTHLCCSNGTDKCNEDLKQWTNMPPISEELYAELVKEFNNERKYFFNDSYIH